MSKRERAEPDAPPVWLKQSPEKVGCKASGHTDHERPQGGLRNHRQSPCSTGLAHVDRHHTHLLSVLVAADLVQGADSSSPPWCSSTTACRCDAHFIHTKCAPLQWGKLSNSVRFLYRLRRDEVRDVRFGQTAPSGCEKGKACLTGASGAHTVRIALDIGTHEETLTNWCSGSTMRLCRLRFASFSRPALAGLVEKDCGTLPFPHRLSAVCGRIQCAAERIPLWHARRATRTSYARM